MNEERLMKVILAPHVTEKSSRGTQKNQMYAFKVRSDASKPEVHEAVELLFKVKVDAVRVLNVKAKKARHGRIEGTHNAWKKAYVTLAEGHSIELAGAEG